VSLLLNLTEDIRSR